METKLRELQEKLAVEEADKLQLQTQLHQCLESEVYLFIVIFFKRKFKCYLLRTFLFYKCFTYVHLFE